MSDPLSLVASGAAVVGLADVLLRASRELYVFFGELKEASHNVRVMLAELDQIGSLLAGVQQCVNEFGTSPFVVEDGLSISEIAKALQACRTEFEHLRNVTRTANVQPDDGM
jgi:hypothetical protein